MCAASTEGRIRVAQIGCGFYGQNHLRAWRDLAADGAELVAVCDLDAWKARAAGEALGFHGTSTL